jgi:hypothetical protein
MERRNALEGDTRELAGQGTHISTASPAPTARETLESEIAEGHH